MRTPPILFGLESMEKDPVQVKEMLFNPPSSILLSAIYWHYQDTHHPYVKSNTVHIEAEVKVNVNVILIFGTFCYFGKIWIVNKIQWSQEKIASSDWNLPTKFCKIVFMKWLQTSKATFITSNNKHSCAKICENSHIFFVIVK